MLPATHTAEEEIKNSGDKDGGVATEAMETGTEAALPTLASSEAIGEVAETVTGAQDWSGPALATEPRKKRGKGPKKAAEEEFEEKDIAAKKVAPKKRGRKAAAVVEEKTEKIPDAKRGRKATASVEEEIRIEEKRAEEAPDLALPEPEVSSTTR